MHEASSCPISVLLVDGDPEAAVETINSIERDNDGFVVESATSVSEAIARLDEADVDCVVSEYVIGDRNGIEFLDAVREEYPDLPFILFTGRGSESAASDAISAGVSDYIRKDPRADRSTRLADGIVDAVTAARTTRARRRHLRAFDTAQEGISIIDEEGAFSYVNQAYADLYGYEPAEMIGEPFTVTYPDGALDVVQADVVPAIEERGFWHGETTGLRADGTTFVEDHTLAKTDDGEIICSVRDKSERQANDRAIEGLHSTVSALMQATTAAEVAEVTVTAIPPVVGLPATLVYRYDGHEDCLTPAAWTDSIADPDGDVPAIPRGAGEAWTVFETGERQVYDDVSGVLDRPAGDTPLRSGMLLPLGDHGVLIAGAPDPDAFDETDLALVQTLAAHATTALDGIQSARELREEREFIDQAIETLNDVFYVVGRSGDLRRWNDRLEEVSGYSDGTIADMTIRELFPADSRERVGDAFEETLASGRATFEAALQTVDGERIPYEFTGARLTDTDGDVTGIVGIGRDVSARKQRERQLERQNERLDEFASMVSHDLRNPLNVAQGRLQLARTDCDSDHIDAIDQAHERMVSLIDDILAISREGAAAIDLGTVPLADVVEESWMHVETYDATLVTATTGTIRADRNQVQQLLENCFRNAVEHGGHDVSVTVGDLDGGFYVEDDGGGIPDAHRERVFDAGFSAADGTGLGLDIVAGIVDAHEWEISVDGGTAGGARFEITGVETGR